MNMIALKKLVHVDAVAQVDANAVAHCSKRCYAFFGQYLYLDIY